MKPVCTAMILLILCAGVPAVLAAGGYQFVSAWGGGTLFGDSATNSTAIAVSDDGFVYAIDRNTIKKFSGDGALIATWDHSSGGQSFLEPDGLAVDSAGNVYVGEHDASYPDRTWVTKLSPSGTPLGTPVLIENAFFKIRGVAIRPGGGLYVGKGNEGVSTQLPRIYANASDGTPLWTQEVYTGMENTVADIAADPTGNVYMMDDGKNSLWKLGPDGTIITKWGQAMDTPMSGDDQFGRPQGICTDASGNIYVADTWNHRIKKLTPDGVLVTKWGAFGAGPGQFNNPRDVAVDKNGTVYVADAGNGRIQKFAEELAHEIVPGSRAPPLDWNHDGLYEDVNGNGRPDFADVVLYFNQMTWIAANEPTEAFDYNANDRIDFADVVWLFNHL